MAAALTAIGTGAAVADSPHSQCGQVSIAHSVDNGATWTTNGRMDGSNVPATVQVKLTGNAMEGCSYPVSLASYSAEGPTWQNSGTQAFLGWDSIVLNSKQTSATLDVSQWAPKCFGQIDLYGNSTKYDGVTGALPHYPDSATPTDLITAWNGGSACASTPSPTATPTPPAATPTPTSSAPAVAPTSTTKPTTAPVTAPPSGTPQVPPTSLKPTGNLAETGSNSSETTIVASAAGALLVVGFGAVFATRRKRASSN